MKFLAALTKAGAKFFGTILGSIGSMLMSAVIIVVIALIGLLASVRFFGPVVLGILAVILAPFIALLGFTIIGKNHKLGTFLLTAATVMVVGAIVQYKFPTVFPGVADLLATTKNSVDQAAEAKAMRMRTPQRVPCLEPYWLDRQGAAAYLAARYRGRIECYDIRKPGNHPITNEPLEPLTSDMIAEIEEGRVAKVVPVTAPPPQVQPTPAPEQWDDEHPITVIGSP